MWQQHESLVPLWSQTWSDCIGLTLSPKEPKYQQTTNTNSHKEKFILSSEGIQVHNATEAE
jgi:hypothetical protein